MIHPRDADTAVRYYERKCCGEHLHGSIAEALACRDASHPLACQPRWGQISEVGEHRCAGEARWGTCTDVNAAVFAFGMWCSVPLHPSEYGELLKIKKETGDG